MKKANFAIEALLTVRCSGPLGSSMWRGIPPRVEPRKRVTGGTERGSWRSGLILKDEWIFRAETVLDCISFA